MTLEERRGAAGHEGEGDAREASAPRLEALESQRALRCGLPFFFEASPGPRDGGADE